MKLFAWFRSVAGKFFRCSATAEEMDEELRAHLQYRADDLEHSGLSRAEAKRHARIEFGGYEKSHEGWKGISSRGYCRSSAGSTGAYSSRNRTFGVPALPKPVHG
jgi:hypothetical protein